jgi:hypothetical protein
MISSLLIRSCLWASRLLTLATWHLARQYVRPVGRGDSVTRLLLTAICLVLDWRGFVRGARRIANNTASSSTGLGCRISRWISIGRASVWGLQRALPIQASAASGLEINRKIQDFEHEAELSELLLLFGRSRRRTL